MRARWAAVVAVVVGCGGNKSPPPVKPIGMENKPVATQAVVTEKPSCIKPPEESAAIAHADGDDKRVTYCVGTAVDQCFAMELASGKLTNLPDQPKAQSPALDATARLDFTIAPVAGTELPLSVALGALELSCERTPETLVPCYGDLVAAVRDRGSEFHGALTEAFSGLLADIFVDRSLGADALPAEIVIARAVPSLTREGTLHLDLTARLRPLP